MSDRRPKEYRDRPLGAALRELEVPEHRPSFEAELRRRLAAERRAARTRPSRVQRRRALRVAAVAAVAAAVAIVAVGIPRTEHSPPVGPEVAGAATIKAKIRSALASMRTLRGELVYGRTGGAGASP
jgi:ferric-dicitrate binding protein FerR (iron transport regulator)